MAYGDVHTAILRASSPPRERIFEGECRNVANRLRVCFKMQGDAISSGFACISRRFSAGLVGSSARKTLQWRVFSGSSARKSVQWTDFSENGSADPRRTGRQAPEPSQGKSTPKCRQRRRNCTSGILETRSNISSRSWNNSVWTDMIRR